MPIPAFNKRGVLDKGIHPCSSQEFMQRFCYGTKTVRSKYKEVLEEIFAFALSRGGSSVILAGSFVTSKEEPNDIDCMMILPNKECCALQSNEFMVVEDCKLDIIVFEESSRESIYSFLNLFSKDKYNLDVGMIELILDEEADKSTWNDYEDYFSIENLLKAREAYINRYVIRGAREKKILVTITNLNEYIFFNNQIAPIVSSSGWVFAPYWYLSANADFSLSDEIDRLGKWLRYIHTAYEADVSIFADGIGTLLLGMYMLNSPHPELSIDKIILSRSTLSSGFNWAEVIEKWGLKMVCSLKSRVDSFTVSESIPKSLKNDSRLGDAYKRGFKARHNSLVNYPYSYSGAIDWEQFKNIIFPIYQMTHTIEKNTESMIRDNFFEIADMLREDQPSQRDLFWKK